MSHVAPKSLYYTIFGSLMVLTVITIGVAFVNLGSFNFPVAIAIAITKATLVVLFFMHGIWSSRLVKLVIGGAVFFLFILLALTMTDFLSRGYGTYDGGSAGAGYGVRTPRPPAVLKVDEGEAAAGTEGAAEPAH